MPIGSPNPRPDNSGEFRGEPRDPRHIDPQHDDYPWDSTAEPPYYDEPVPAPDYWQQPIQPPQSESRRPNPRPAPPTRQPRPSAGNQYGPAANPPRSQGQLAPRPALQPGAQQPGAIARNRGVQIVPAPVAGRPAPPNRPPVGRPNGDSRLPLPPTNRRQEVQPSKRSRRMVIGGLATVLVFGGAAGAVSAFGGNNVKANKKTTVVGEAPDVSALGPKTSTPTPTPTPTPSPTKKSSTPTPTPTPSPKETNKAPVAPIVPAAADCVSELPPSVLIAQKIMAPVYSNNLKEMAPIFNKRHIGGAILLFSSDTPKLAPGSINTFKKQQDIKIEFATDQEGGDMSVKKSATTGYTPVSRIQAPISKLQPNGYMPTAAEMAKLKPEQITDIVAENYAYLKEQGVTTSFGMVLDVANTKGTSTIGTSRVASADPKIVTQYAKARLAGAKKAGVYEVGKHWGMGSASANTDKAPAVTPPFSELQKRDFLPYLDLKSAGLKFGGMIGSEEMPGLSDGADNKAGTADDVPVSLSREAVTDQFKKVYLSEGVVTYTDDLGAKAISNKWSVADASVEAWKAGVDEALFVVSANMTAAEQLDANIAAGKAALKSGELNRSETEASVMRILGNKGLTACGVLKTVDSGSYNELVAKMQKKSSTATKKAPSTPSPTPTKSALPAPASTKPTPTPTAKPVAAKS